MAETASGKEVDDTLIAMDRRNYRMRVIGRLPLYAFIVLLALRPFVVSLRELENMTNGHFLIWMNWLFVFAVAPALITSRLFPRIALPLSALRKNADHVHGRWRLASLLAIVVMLNTASLWPQLHPDWSLAALFALMATMMAVIVCFGHEWWPSRYRALTDELIKTLRWRAATFGYLFAMVAMGTAYVVITLHPDWTFAVMRWLLAASCVVPLLLYNVLEWRAGLGVSS